MLQQECLTAEELTAYQLGELPPEQGEALARHLESCPHCSAAVARLDDLTDGVIAALRGLRPPAPAPGNASDTFLPPSPAQDCAPGPPQALAGYEVMEEIGRGGMGVVYKARHRELNRLVALKMVLAGPGARAEQLARFLVEAEMVARLSHPNIVSVHEAGAHQGRPFIALEYVPGGTLADRLTGQPWPPRQAAALVEALARAMDHAHRQGVVHRDLKPANVLLSYPSPPAPLPEAERGEEGRRGALSAPPFPRREGGTGGLGDAVPKITDFGIAKLVGAHAGLTGTGAVLGTPSYMAPEQASGDGGRVGPACDVYALGVILYEMLAGAPPFRGATHAEVLIKVVAGEPPSLRRAQPRLPRDLCVICERCLEKEPARRYPSAGALADDLRRFLAGEPIRARPVGELERAWKWAKRRPAVAGLLAAVVLSLLGGAGTSAYLALEERGRAREAEVARDDARTAEDNASARADDARQAAVTARAAQANAVRAREKAELWAGRLSFRAGVAAAEAGQVDRGLFFMLRALRDAPADAGLQRVVRANLAAWVGDLPVQRLALEDQGRRGWFLGAEGDTFATVTPRNAVQRWDTATGKKVGSPTRPLPGRIQALSDDAGLALTLEPAGAEGEVLRLREVATGRAVGGLLHRGLNAYTSAGFAPGGLVWVRQGAERDGEVVDRSRIFRARTGEQVGPPLTDDFRLFLARDGGTVLMTFPHPAAAEADQPPAQARFTDLDSGRPLAGCDPAPGGGSVCFDGRALVTVRRGVVRWWSPATGKQVRQPWRPGRTMYDGYLLGDGRSLVMLRTDRRLAWFDLGTRREHPVSVPTTGEPSLAVRPDGTALLVGSATGPLRLWRVESLPAPPGRVEGRPRFAAFAYSPDRRLVYAGALWAEHADFGKLLDSCTGHPVGRPLTGATYGPTFSGDGRLLATHTAAVKGAVPAVQVWDTATGLPRGSRLTVSAYVHGLAFAPDHHTLAVGTVRGTLLWDVRARSPRAALQQEAPVSTLLFSPDGKWLATGGRSGWTGARSTFCLWEATTGKQVGKPVPTADAARFCFRPDSRVLCTYELSEGRLRRWDVAPLRERGSASLLHPTVVATQALFAQGGKVLLTGHSDGRALQWDTDSGKLVGKVMSHPAPVTALAASPDGKLVAVGCEDGSAWLRDAATGLTLGPPRAFRAAVQALAFSADGAALLGIAADGAPFSWPVPAPLTQSPGLLEDWLRAATGAELDGEGVVLLDAGRWRQARWRLKKDWPAAAAELARPADLKRWHEARARQAEVEGASSAWDHDRLIALQGAAPKSWRARACRAHLLARAGRSEAADAEYRALAPPAGAALPDWYRHQAAEARQAREWALSHWYLDRLIALRPQEWQLYEQRASVRAFQGRKADARADRLRAVEAGAGPDVLGPLADELAEEGCWQKAGELLALAERRWGLSVPVGERLALVHLRLGQVGPYRALAARALKGLAGKVEIGQAVAVARACTLAPGSVTDWAPLLELTAGLEAALPRLELAPAPEDYKAQVRYQALCARAAVLDRAGRPREALARLKALRAPGGEGRHLPLLALAHARLGEKKEARAWLAEARRWLRDHPPGKVPWHARLPVQLLADEAEKLLTE